MYGAGFTAGSLARKGARGGMSRTGKKVGSDKELTEVGRMPEGDRGDSLVGLSLSCVHIHSHSSV